MRIRGILILVVVLSTTRPARAEEALSWSLTETLLLEWHGETGMQQSARQAAHDRDNYVALQNRVNLGLRRGPLDVAFRFDQSTFWETCSQMPADPEAVDIDDILECRSPRPGVLHDDYRLERATARLRFGRHRLWVGDFPVLVGRGLVLALRKVSEFGLDDALRGARGVFQLHDALELDLFGGVVNVSNIDEVSNTRVEESRDRVLGARVEGHLPNGAAIGVHSVMIFPLAADGVTDVDPVGGRWTGLFGGTVNLPRLLSSLSMFLEADALVRDLVEGGQDHGYAIYSSLDLELGRLTLLGEFKWYDNFLVRGTVTEGEVLDGEPLPRPLSQPPTLERQDQLVINNSDVVGGRVRSDVLLGRGLLLFANINFIHGRRSHLSSSIHAFGGLELDLYEGRLSATVSAGYRRELYRENAEAPLDWSNLFAELIHVEANASWRVTGRHGLHLSFLHETWNKPVGDRDHYSHRGTLTVGYDYGSRVSVSVSYEYDTLVGTNIFIIENEEGTWEVPTEVRQHFAFGEVRYTPLRWLDLRLRGGTQRGGLRCLSGVCRVFPNFAGVRFESVVRF